MNDDESGGGRGENDYHDGRGSDRHVAHFGENRPMRRKGQERIQLRRRRAGITESPTLQSQRLEMTQRAVKTSGLDQRRHETRHPNHDE